MTILTITLLVLPGSASKTAGGIAQADAVFAAQRTAVQQQLHTLYLAMIAAPAATAGVTP